jgi:hypothetical protein
MIATSNFGLWRNVVFFVIVLIAWCAFVVTHRIELSQSSIAYDALMHKRVVVPLSEIKSVEAGRVEVGRRSYGHGLQAIRIEVDPDQSPRRKPVTINARLFNDVALERLLATLDSQGNRVKGS